MKTYEDLKANGLQEFIFSTPGGFRHFFVLGKNLKDAENNFMRCSDIARCGFTLNDLPIRKLKT